ncbi:hypothetical protein R6Q59_010572 [Mikania micrantha]
MASIISTHVLMTSCKTLNIKCYAIVVLLLVATFLFSSSEARTMSLESVKDAITHHKTHEAKTISTENDHEQDSGFVVVIEADLRPTTPGHSPGVGHSFGPTASDPQP